MSDNVSEALDTPAAVHANRRARVLAQLAERRGALVVPAGPELHYGGDGEMRYLPDPDLFYLAGYIEPEAVLVLNPALERPFSLFVRDRDAERERWTGPRAGVAETAALFQADAAFDIAELAARLPALLDGAHTVFAPLQSGRPDVDAALLAALAAARRTRVRTGRGPHTVADPRLVLAPLRLRKDAHELALMREAARLSVAAYQAAARTLPHAAGEWQIEAALEHAFRAGGGSGPAFPSIVAGGANATVLHYTRNDAPLRPGDLLLIDAGARYRMYCADITRTWPVSGAFTAAQRAVYDVVLAAHDAGIAAACADAPSSEVHDAALGVLIDGMIDLRLVNGPRDAALERGDFRRYFPHRTSHWLGLEVHDVGDYVDEHGTPIRLEPGMVLTVEPGVYVPADDESAPHGLRGIGIRLEDDVLVTVAGPDVLTAGLAIRPDDVEQEFAGAAAPG